MITLDQLEIIEKINETGSFRGAAEALHRAQSAVSYGVKKLEEEVGIEIFDRSSYRAQLTEQGRHFLDRSAVILESVRQLEKYARNWAKGREPELKLAIESITPYDLLLKSVHGFSNSVPETKVSISMEVLGASTRLLRRECDLAILVEDQVLPPTVERWRLAAFPMVFVCAAAHPLAKVDDATRALLSRYPQIIMHSTVAETKPVNAGVYNRTNNWSVTDYLTKKNLLLGGAGWGAMPEHLIHEELQSGTFARIRSRELRETRATVFAARFQNEPIGPSNQQLWEILKAAAIEIAMV